MRYQVIDYTSKVQHDRLGYAKPNILAGFDAIGMAIGFLNSVDVPAYLFDNAENKLLTYNMVEV
jgi:hypothetical protein